MRKTDFPPTPDVWFVLQTVIILVFHWITGIRAQISLNAELCLQMARLTPDSWHLTAIMDHVSRLLLLRRQLELELSDF